MRSLGLIALALLAGCASKPLRCPVCPTTPVTFDVPVAVREPLPAGLAEPVPDPVTEAIVTVGDAVRAARERKAALDKANARLRQISELRAKPSPDGE
jgi:hypothetical protein